MKLNRMICPSCSHEALADCAYTRCDSCGVTFYASQSRPVFPMQTRVAMGGVTINGIPYPHPLTGGFDA